METARIWIKVIEIMWFNPIYFVLFSKPTLTLSLFTPSYHLTNGRLLYFFCVIAGYEKNLLRINNKVKLSYYTEWNIPIWGFPLCRQNGRGYKNTMRKFEENSKETWDSRWAEETENK